MDLITNKLQYLSKIHEELESFVEVFFTAIKDEIKIKLPFNIPNQTLREASDLIMLLLSESSHLLASTYSQLMKSPKHFALGLFTTVIMKALFNMLQARLRMMKVIKILSILLFLSISPASLLGTSQDKNKYLQDSLKNINSSVSDINPQRSAEEAKQSLAHSSLLGVLIKETPELAVSMFELGKVYWKLGNQIYSLFKLALPIVKHHSSGYAELTKVFLQMTGIMQKMQDKKQP
jgi:hypothetical protein